MEVLFYAKYIYRYRLHSCQDISETRKLLTPIIHNGGFVLCKKHIPLCLSLYMGQIQIMVYNKIAMKIRDSISISFACDKIN